MAFVALVPLRNSALSRATRNGDNDVRMSILLLTYLLTYLFLTVHFYLVQAAILQRAVDYIVDLHRQKANLVAKNARLMQLLDSGAKPEVTSSSSAVTSSSLQRDGWAMKRERLQSLSSCSLSSDDGACAATAENCTSGPPPRRRRPPEVERRDVERKPEVGVDGDLEIWSLRTPTAEPSSLVRVYTVLLCRKIHSERSDLSKEFNCAASRRSLCHFGDQRLPIPVLTGIRIA